MNGTANLEDAHLVQLSLSGDRRAFEEIVRRNLSPVAAAAYAITGSPSLSEDVTQEVFLTAWQRMRELREPAKLRSWLCAIARNAAHALHRKTSKDPLRNADELENASHVATATASPAEAAIAAEQQQLVWSALERIPENYRVPMVMYYREGQSAAQVAEALELNEEAVRQRLSRARAMLKDEVAKIVEASITATRPSPLLVTAIMAGLATGAMQVSAATMAAAGAAKASAAGGAALGDSALGLTLLSTVLGPLIGIAGGIIGTRSSLRAAKTPEERRLIIRMVWQMCGLILVLFLSMAVIVLAGIRGWISLFQSFVTGGILIGSYIVALVTMVIRGNRRHMALARQRADFVQITFLEQQLDFVRNLRGRGRYHMLAAYGGGVYGSLSGPIVQAAAMGDHLLAGGMLLAATALVVGGYTCTQRRPQNYLLHLAIVFFSVGVAYISIAAYWNAAGLPHFLRVPARANMPPTIEAWLLPALLVLFFLPFTVVALVQHRKFRAALSSQPVKI